MLKLSLGITASAIAAIISVPVFAVAVSGPANQPETAPTPEPVVAAVEENAPAAQVVDQATPGATTPDATTPDSAPVPAPAPAPTPTPAPAPAPTCSYFIDANGDGVCDHCADRGHGHGAGYVDHNGDGVCDYYDNHYNGTHHSTSTAFSSGSSTQSYGHNSKHGGNGAHH